MSSDSLMATAAVLGELLLLTLLRIFIILFASFATFTSVSTLEDCFNSAPHWVDGKQVRIIVLKSCNIFRKLFLQVEMRKVGVDGGAANGSTGGTKRSAPGHGPPKNRSLQENLICQILTNFLPAGFSLGLLPVRRTGEKRALMGSMTTSPTMTFAHSSCTLGQSPRSGSIGRDQKRHYRCM